MAIDNSFIIKKLQGLPEMFVIFSQSTKHPYVTCNEESFDDQIHIFSDAEAAHAYVVAKNEQEKIPVVSVRVAAEQFLHFYGTLYALGVNGVVLHDNDTEPLSLLKRSFTEDIIRTNFRKNSVLSSIRS